MQDMNSNIQLRSAITNVLSACLIDDVIGVVWLYAKRLKHRWQEPTDQTYRLQNAATTAGRIDISADITMYSRFPFSIGMLRWTFRIDPEDAYFAIGIGMETAGRQTARSYRLTTDGFYRGCQFIEHNKPSVRPVEQVTLSISINRNQTANRNRRLPDNQFGDYGFTASVGPVYSLASLSFVVDGVDLGIVFEDIPNIEELFPHAFLFRRPIELVAAC